MIQIVIQNNIADQIRQSVGQIELVDDKGQRVGVVRRPPTDDEIKFAKARMRLKGSTITVDELISKVEAL